MRLAENRSIRRRATATVEVVFALPLLVLLLLATLEFTMLLLARQQLLQASRDGARVGAQGGTDQEIRETVARVLGCGRLASARTDIRRLTETTIGIGNNRERIEVVVYAPMAIVAPNWLGWVGINFANHEMVAGTVMNIE